jgi:hypothetical protein
VRSSALHSPSLAAFILDEKSGDAVGHEADAAGVAAEESQMMPGALAKRRMAFSKSGRR